MSAARAVCAALVLLSAPVLYVQAATNAGGPGSAIGWNGFRMAEIARGRLVGDPAKPETGLSLGPGAEELARGAYAREPLAGDALFVLALAQSPLRQDYRAGTIARQAAVLDKRNALLQLLMIADSAGREDFGALFAHADVLAATHPGLTDAVLAPLFERLGDPATVPLLAAALRKAPRWAASFQRNVPKGAPALRNYLALRRELAEGRRWESDEKLVAALAAAGMYGEAFAFWRELAGRGADRSGFVHGTEYAPIGWQVTQQGERSARVGSDGRMTVWIQRGAGGELARRLLQLAPGHYALETRISSDETSAPLAIALTCAKGGQEVRQPLANRIEFVVSDAACPAYWLILSGSAFESRHGIEATISAWRLSRTS